MSTVEDLFDPISADSPCGADLSFSSELDAIAHARRFDDPSLDQGEWASALKEADWPFVVASCSALLRTHSKDLRIAVWLAEAHAKTRRLRGLGDGFLLVQGLCERFWDGLYPPSDEGEYEQRIGNLYWLLTRTPDLIREVPVTEAGGAYTLADFDSARLRAVNQAAPSDYDFGGEKIDAGPALATLEAARKQTPARFYDALLADAEYCLDAMGHLEATLDVCLGPDGPGFTIARETLQTLIQHVAPLTSKGKSEGLAGPQQMVGEVGIVRSTSGGLIQTRAQALSQLRVVAEFFRRTEPHSPVAYLAEKAAAWGELPLHLWLRAVVKDAGALAQLEEMLGAPPRSD